MSQQTTLVVVLPRFNEFIKKLPTVHALADVSDETLRSLWAGLGYYARARNLRSGAQYIVAQLGGAFPQTFEEWLRVPGVGPYTASVIVSICYGLPKACVDGNVIRVMARLTGTSSAEVWSESGRFQIQNLADRVIDQSRPGDFNQAMMELGALICRKQTPDCASCPVQSVCRANKLQIVESCPPNKPRKEFIQLQLFALILSSGSESARLCENIFLAERRQGFLSGTLGFPLIPVPDVDAMGHMRNELVQLADVASIQLSELNVRHTITRHKLEVGQLHIAIKPRGSLQESTLKKVFEILGLRLGRETWVSKNLVPEKVSSSLDLKVWEKIS
jgi:A/G-specific adenine glycosylase